LANLNTIIEIVFIITVIGAISYNVFYIIANIIFRALDDSSENHIFEITKGDKQQNDRIRKHRNKNRVKIIINGILALIYNIGCGILTNILSK
jgi:hypothetical protein